MSVRVFLLGRFEVARGDLILRAPDWSRRKAALLFQRLAFERRLLKDQAIDFLWPETSPEAGANNLYRTLHALRQTLDTGLGAGTAEGIFSFEDGLLVLSEAVWVDAHEFQKLAQAATNRERPDTLLLQSALDLYQGDLLPDTLYEDWLVRPRESLRRLHREVSLALAQHYQDTGNYNLVVSLLNALLTHDLADETIHRQLMCALALAGRRHEALRQYQTCVDALAAELDVPPEPETTELYKQILNGQLKPPAPLVAPAWRPPTPFIHETERSGLLVGREVELEALCKWMSAAWQGQGKTIFLTGDAGIGKTRLAYEALQTASSSGMTVLLGAAYEQEGQLPYQPYIEAFDRYLTERGRSHEENPITHFKGLSSGNLQQDHWALFNATVNFLMDLAKQAPVVLFIDDLYAADETSLQLFHYLARQTRSAPVILLATYRVEAASQVATPFNVLLNALYREHFSEILHLMPLPENAVSKVMSHVLGGQIAPTLATAVLNITEGNPFFVLEIAHALEKSSQLEVQSGQWDLKPGMELQVPTGLGGLLRERVARLGPSVETALATAAVIGREFGFDVLRGTVTLSDSELLDALDVALNGQLLEETENGYSFRHLLIRQTLYDALGRTRRALLHGRVAQAIESVYAQRGLEPYVEDLAFHYELSNQRERALPYLIRAGNKAAQVFAFEVAVHYLERALSLMDELDITAPARRWALHEQLGWWSILMADTPRAVAHFEQALALEADDGWQPEHGERARLHRGAALALITAGQMAAAETHLRSALAEIDEHDDATEYAQVLYHKAQFHWHQGEYREAFEAAQQSLAVAEQLNDPSAIASAFEMLALACHSLGEWQQGLDFEQRRSALAGPGLDVTDAFDMHL
jgi:predicted ATPase